MSDNKLEKRGLGRGLSALMADVDLIPSERPAPRQILPVEQLTPNPDQPRRHFAPEALQELAASLKSRGMLQPLIVRPHPSDRGLFQIVAGERRWRAAQIAQLHEVPVIVRDLSDTEVLEVAIVEKHPARRPERHRGGRVLSPVMDRFGHTQEKLADALNKSRSHIANLLRLLNLPEQVQAWLKEGKLSAGHARALITAPNAVELARKVIEKGLSVRETEELVRRQAEAKAAKPARPRAEKMPIPRALEGDLTAHLKMKVAINHAGQDGGQLVITYRDLDQLDRLCGILAGN